MAPVRFGPPSLEPPPAPVPLPTRPHHDWSEQQRAIFDWFARGTGNLVVRARAGSGKTSTILEGVEHAPDENILLAAFNKRIAEELQARLANPRAEAMTLHSAGFRVLKSYWRGVRIAERQERADGLAVRACRELLDATDLRGKIHEPADSVVRLVSKLCSLGRECAPFAKSGDDLLDLAYAHECVPNETWDLSGWSVGVVCRAAQRAMELAKQRPGPDSGIDFSDMLYLPVVMGWARPCYDLVTIDECLPRETPVLMADGTSKRIYDVREGDLVLSFDTEGRAQVTAKVTKWHEIPNRKPLVKVSVRYPAQGHQGRNFVTCTIDHKVWTDRGWVAAGDLVIGDVVQVETSAAKSQAYKITSRGRRTLSELRSADNGERTHTAGNGFTRRGGNGCAPTKEQLALYAELGGAEAGWVLEHVVRTGKKRGSGFPYFYSVDMAKPSCKIAVEVDGGSHAGEARRASDRRKDQLLRRKKWRVFRFTNRQAWQQPGWCTAKVLTADGCPREATVVAVEPVDIRDSHVYDITVEGTHCFYANGVLVHNCQDMNATQIELAKRLSSGRVCVVGDEKQGIYKFRGADSGSLDRLKKELDAQELGLNTTYRCGKSIVAVAQRYVPDFQAGPTNPQGLVRDVAGTDALMGEVRAGDAILSRLNAPLVSLCLKLLKLGTPARIEGRDVAAGLRAVLKELAVGRAATSVPELLAKVRRWEDREVARAMRGVTGASSERVKARAELVVEAVRDKASALLALCDGAMGVQEVRGRIETVFADTRPGERERCVTLSTVHKAKGLEWRRVYLLADTFTREGGEEDNIRYVAVTRAKEELVWVR